MSEKDIDIWNECCQEMSPEGQQEADVLLRNVTKKLKGHIDEYNESRNAHKVHGKGVQGIGTTGAKELIIALIRAGYL